MESEATDTDDFIDEQIRECGRDSCTHCDGEGEFINNDGTADCCPKCDGLGFIIRN